MRSPAGPVNEKGPAEQGRLAATFRARVPTAYEYRCAVCGFDVRLGSVSVALDAAHIRWHQAGGPDEERHGLALCVLHHKLFDLGAFTLAPGCRLLVSDQVNGTSGVEEALMRHHGGRVKPAQPRLAAGCGLSGLSR
jgi:putative restriction endonuclease